MVMEMVVVMVQVIGMSPLLGVSGPLLQPFVQMAILWYDRLLGQ